MPDASQATERHPIHTHHPEHHHDHHHPERPVHIHINERRVHLDHHRATGLKIKEEAIKQGVPIQLDFTLFLELKHDRTKVIGDRDVVELTNASRFLANPGDDNA